jgi:hypothetical protein
MKKTIYLAGPMSGLPDFNYPAFNAAAAKLRALGHTVLNPAENPVPACGTWAGYMRLALAQLVQCECIVLLPGWAESKGALVERKLAQVLGMEVLHFVEAQMLEQVPLMSAFDDMPRPAVDWSAA